MRSRWLWLAAALCAVSAQADDDRRATLRQIVGILELSAAADGQPPAVFTPPLVLQRTPGRGGEAFITLNWPDALRQLEWGYETLGPAVYGYRYVADGGWYQVSLTDGRRGWVAERGGWRLHHHAELIREGLAHLTGDWDGTLRAHPGDAESATRVPLQRAEGVRVADTATVAGRLWLLVVVMADPPCTAEPAARVLASGWIPAQDAEGDPTVWFYSRGC